jgi:phospholipid/cholesterol/gamma-HCH transport system substrate-binding protein
MSPVLRTRRGARRRKPRVHPLAIALLTIGATVFITYYAFSQSLPFQHRFTIYAIVNNSVNVRSDSPVRIAGIDVGSVQGTSPYGRATKIKFTVNSNGLPIHKDATITIRDRLFLEGGYYLQINPGSPRAPVLGDGGTIPLSQTATPVQFYKVLSVFNSAARSDLTNFLNTLNIGLSPNPGQPESDSGAGYLKTAIPPLTQVLKNSAITAEALQGTSPNDIPNLLESSSSVTATLANNSAQLVDLVVGLNHVSSALAATDGSLGQTIQGLDQTLTVAPAALSAVDHALPPVVNLADALDPSLKVAPPLIDAITGAVEQLGAIVAPPTRNALLGALNATFVQFPSVLTELGKAFPISKQLTDCLLTHVVPTLNKVVPDGILTSHRTVWQDFVHFLPNVAGATGSFDGNGPFTRTLVGAGSDSLTGGDFGTIPGVGKIVGSSPPGNGSLLGARPHWVGDLQPSAFRPDIKCSTQPVPSLASPVTSNGSGQP